MHGLVWFGLWRLTFGLVLVWMVGTRMHSLDWIWSGFETILSANNLLVF
jgi:hypothetical protein